MSGLKGSCLLISYGYTLNDPPAQQTARSLAEAGWDVTILQTRPAQGLESLPLPSVKVVECQYQPGMLLPAPLSRIARWRAFRRQVAAWIEANRPSLIVTIMLHSLASLPARSRGNGFNLVSCVYDIPSMQDAGHLDKRILRGAWDRLSEAAVVWSSDVYKAKLTQQFGNLVASPLVCHNAPPQDYLTEPIWPRNPWLRNELRRQGASIGEIGGCILLRAGAVGEWGGIEATLAAMRQLPEDFVFLMMGRPNADYERNTVETIDRLGLGSRAFLWTRPSDQVWRRALTGADIGHLIHGPFPAGAPTRLYALNSSLSNNRLFQYMAAGLPIISYDDPRLVAIEDEVDCFRVVRLEHIEGDIKKYCAQLGENSALRRTLGENSRRAHLSKYCWEKQFEKVSSALEDLK